MNTARLIALEGGDSSGKSTQARLLAETVDGLLTREPGGTPVGEHIRDLLLDRAVGHIDPRAEALLMAAARAQHVAEVIKPALMAGRTVITDRFSHSSLAYQGYGRGLDLDEVRWLSGWATEGLWPDLVIFIDVDPEIAAARMMGDRDRLEAEGRGFHERVVAGFRALAEADPAHWAVVDGDGTVEEVAVRVLNAYEGRNRA